jgi:hypothetical protein
MEIEENNKICEICLVQFDDSALIPKKMECCIKCFCLKCLSEIYQKNNNTLLCPTCRRTTNKDPINLTTEKSLLVKIINCPVCSHSVRQDELKITLEDNILCIVCNNCYPFNNVLDKLDKYVNKIIPQMQFYLSNFEKIDTELLEKKIVEKIDEIVYIYFDGIIVNTKNKLKRKVKDIIIENYNIDINPQALKDNCLEFNNNFNKIKKFQEEYTNFKDIQESLSYYMNQGKIFTELETDLQKIYSEIEKDNFIKLNNIFKIEDFENKLVNSLVITINDKEYKEECKEKSNDNDLNSNMNLILVGKLIESMTLKEKLNEANEIIDQLLVQKEENKEKVNNINNDNIIDINSFEEVKNNNIK